MAGKNFNSVTVSAVVGILFLFATLWNLQATDPLYTRLIIPANISMAANKTNSTSEDIEPVAPRPSFLEIGTKHGTDKVTDHHYNFMYEKYLEPLRDKPLKMLEIGLGCNMHYGPGKSYYTWLEYLPNVDLYYIEYDRACVEKWAANMTNVKIFTGDQADIEFLNTFITSSGGGFDIIIDDGGHTMNQQMTSLNMLFPIVKPGGIYFCEDLATSYLEGYGAIPGQKTMMEMIGELLHDLNSDLAPEWGAPQLVNKVGKQMRGVECGEEICAFFKKDLGRTEVRV